MTTNNHADVGEFHQKFGLKNTLDDEPGQVTMEGTGFIDMVEFRIKFMREELTEFCVGFEEEDIAQMADALVDLAYVVMGTAHMLGLPWDQLWDDVQRANMTKERAAADGSNSKRGSSLDVIKPAGWQGPHTREILAEHGFEV